MKASQPVQPDPVRTAQVMLYLFARKDLLESRAEARERLQHRHWCYW